MNISKTHVEESIREHGEFHDLTDKATLVDAFKFHFTGPDNKVEVHTDSFRHEELLMIASQTDVWGAAANAFLLMLIPTNNPNVWTTAVPTTR